MPRFAYLFSTFPTLSTTFVQQQVAETRELGLDPILIATRPPAEGDYHPKDDYLLRQTFYLSRIKWWSYLRVNINTLMRSPKRYLQGIRYALNRGDHVRGQPIRNLIYLAGAAVLADHLIKKGVTHVHVHFAYGAATIAIFLEILTDIPYSLSVHGSDVLLPGPLTDQKLKRALFVVANSQYMVEDIRKRFLLLPGHQLDVVRYGVKIRSGPWSKPQPVSLNKPFRLLNVARLDPVKAQDILIKACAIIRHKGIDIRCRIVGNGPQRKELEDLIKAYDLESHIELMGGCYQDEVVRLYDWSQVVVLSSLSEGTPMVVVEAMAKARPVVAPDITGIPEMIADNQTGFLFKKGSPEDLADRMMRLFETPEAMEHMGREGRKRALKIFDLEKNARELMGVFSRELPALGLGPGEEINTE
jgi:glycosyltransferase involved in cell wall biosynthesis